MQGRHRIKKQVSSNPKLRDYDILKIPLFFFVALIVAGRYGEKESGAQIQKNGTIFLYSSGQKTYN